MYGSEVGGDERKLDYSSWCVRSRYHGTKAQSLLGDLLSFAFCRRNECYFKDQLSVVRYKTGYVNAVELQYLFNATYST